LFYLRGVADESIKTTDIYKGVVPFILIQLAVLLIVIIFPFFIL
jgi:TRAP-type mannitol/chloroaromatic compound transport system permease large subunit